MKPTSCLHGQSIKTRVEAPKAARQCKDHIGVYTDNPLKQGLKLVPIMMGDSGGESTRTIH